MKAVWDQSDRKTQAFGKPASRGQAQGFTSGALFQTGHTQAQLVGCVWTRLPGRGAGPQGSGPGVGSLLAAHSSVNKMDRPSSQGNQPSRVTPEFLSISRYSPHAKQQKSTWTQAGFCVCLSTLNKEPKTASWQKHGEIKYLNGTHVCRMTEFLYFHGPQNVLEWPQVSQKESPYRLLMRVWIL